MNLLKKLTIKKIILLFSSCILFIGLSIYFSNRIIKNNAKGKLYNTIKNIPKNKVGLVLGTSKTLANGRVNLYYKYRLASAISLWKSEKINIILVSGDNGTEGYDEPTTFKEDLLKAGIPEEKIVLDYAGFRTLDSAVRAKKIFGQNNITFISQQFHNERAIYLAEHFGINAIGFNAQNVSKHYGFKTNLREYLARVKVFVDIITRKQPKFLGDKIVIE